MNFQRFKKKKQPNNKRGIILVLVLMLIIYLWINAESLIAALFTK